MPVVPTCRPDGSKLERLRTERGFSAAALARALGPHRAGQTIRDIERNRTSPSLVLMHQIARVLEVDPSELIPAAGSDAA